DVIASHEREVFRDEVVRFAQRRQPLKLFLFLLLEDLCALEVTFCRRTLERRGVPAQLPLAIEYLGREIRFAQLHTSTRFVDDVYGFVREESIRNVALRSVDCGLHGVLCVTHLMEGLVSVFYSLEDLHRFGFGGRRHLDRLEAPFE